MRHPRRAPHRCLLGPALALLSCIAMPARAHWSCPAGVDPFGPNNTGVACVWMDDGGDEGGFDEGGFDEGGAPSPPPMVHYSPEEWQAFIDAAVESDRRAEEERMRDPVYRALKTGTWDLAETPPDSAVRVCSATFLTLAGGVMLLDIQGDKGGSFLGFYGGGIERTKNTKIVRLSLTQSGETQTVNAMQAPFPMSRALGMYLFRVPNTTLLLDSIEDEQDFAIARDGAVMTEGRWRDGGKAREWMRTCTTK